MSEIHQKNGGGAFQKRFTKSENAVIPQLTDKKKLMAILQLILLT
jgi:hypothetical protein